ncbi:MAG: peroxiredoxin [Proteobacteria bacterium]|uniref:Glutathione-dependent peroxiredoxin n=1 Tax=SAR92 bacterium BACL26 MAG-121220-bin70 TaxID=1655626 RepID=A0A0R2U7U4_9GAMM|nr:MAG: peroxiredoxin [SAR92 bacterium BACL26 MAG-121220-bin70]MDA0794905.1 peroxiredoxin [Pseudomonadota bacterium]MDA1350936.1 peroxiredoxin [Pseudomonadota bacterium]
MTIKVGDKVPAGMFTIMGAEGPVGMSTADIFDGKKVVLFAVPGAFTPTCSMAHLPGFVVHVDEIKSKGVDTVACMSVNDVFVMNAWGQSANAEHLVMLADGNADFTTALGLELDGSGFGMGKRSQRFAMIVDDGVVSLLNVDAGALEGSSAEAILAAL